MTPFQTLVIDPKTDVVVWRFSGNDPSAIKFYEGFGYKTQTVKIW